MLPLLHFLLGHVHDPSQFHCLQSFSEQKICSDIEAQSTQRRRPQWKKSPHLCLDHTNAYVLAFLDDLHLACSEATTKHPRLSPTQRRYVLAP